MNRRFLAVAMAALSVAGCATYTPAPPLSAEDMAAKCKRQEEINFWTEDCLDWKRRRDAELAARNKAEEAQRAAYWETQREQQAKQEQEAERQEAEAIRKDEKKGYKHITFEDFALDGPKMKGAKVSIRGFYVDKGERLFRDRLSIGRWIGSGDGGKGVNIPLLTEDASRDARAIFLRRANANMSLGCGMVIRGRVELLTLRNRLGVEWREVGIAVETVRP